MMTEGTNLKRYLVFRCDEMELHRDGELLFETDLEEEALAMDRVEAMTEAFINENIFFSAVDTHLGEVLEQVFAADLRETAPHAFEQEKLAL